MINVLVIIPYEETRVFYERVIDRYSNQGVSFTITSFFGTDFRKLQIIKNYDIVVVRGMTRVAIKSFFPNNTVIPITVNTSDLLEALLTVKKQYGSQNTVGVLYSDSFMCSEETISNLSGMDILMRSISNEVDMVERMNELINKGCKVFVGGQTLQNYCSTRKIPIVTLKTGDATIEKSIEDAFNAASIMKNEIIHADLLQLVSDNLLGPMLVCNAQKEVVTFNIKASQLFGKSLEVGKSLPNTVPKSIVTLIGSKRKAVEEVETLGDDTYLITFRSIEVEKGEDLRIVNFKKTEEVYDTEKKVRSQMVAPGFIAKYSFEDIVAEQLSMRQIIAKAMRYSKSDAPVFLQGETGTGKELFAQSIHNSSSRAYGPFVAVNCATISEQSLEYELFGYEGQGGKPGLFELAQKGTLFLDGICEMSLRLQAMLLRVLLEREVRRVGGSENIPVDVRVISATNKNITSMIESGLFRLDLYYRLNVLYISIPPLRERPLDIEPLFRLFISRYVDEHKIPMPQIEREAISELEKHVWPGNAIEVRNIANRVMVSGGERKITGSVIREMDLLDQGIGVESYSEKTYLDSQKKFRASDVSHLYQQYVKSGLNLEEFAHNQGISRTTLWRRFKNLKQN